MNEYIQRLSKNIVKINSAIGSGSGFYIKSADIVITNYHVIAGSKSVALETIDKRKIKANVIQVNPLADIALLKPATPISANEFIIARNSRLHNTDKVMVLGYPYGMPFSITEGIISSPRQLVDGQNYIQTDAPINPGNSGGPMINKNGEIIGITTSKFTNAENIGFAIPSITAALEIDSFLKNGVDSYGVKCPSCSYLLTKKDEFCENCGGKLDADKLFEEIPLSPLAIFIEDAITKIGLDPLLARNGREYWEFYHGSALLRYFVYKNNYFFASSSLTKIPKINPVNLYTYILSNPVSPYKLGIYEGKVYLSYRSAISDIFSSEKDHIKNDLILFAVKADEIDNLLVEKYGCEWDEESKK